MRLLQGTVRETPFRLRVGPEWIVLFFYVSLVAFIIPFHEPWTDEAQAWELARHASIPELFGHLLRYEGTPGLWHLLLWFLSRLHVSYTGLHWFAGALAAGACGLLLFRAPFPRLFRLTLPFTFFLSYQYAVVARSYVLVPLLLFAVASMWKGSPIKLALMLGLLANVAVYSFVVSLALAVVYSVELLAGDREMPDGSALRRALAILLFLYGAALFTTFPSPQDLSFYVAKPTGHVLDLVRLWPSRCIIPLIRVLATSIWLSIVLWLVCIAGFVRARAALYLLPVVALTAALGYYYSWWHAGLLIPTLIAVCWIACGTGRRFGVIFATVAIFWIGSQAGWTIRAFVYDYANAYSPDRDAARFLAPRVSDGHTAAVTFANDASTLNAYPAEGLAPYFDRSIFMNQHEPYWLWSSHDHTNAEFEADVAQEPDVVVVEYLGTRPLNWSQDLSGEHVSYLRSHGYGLVAIFCGAKPEGSRIGDTTCHLIYERAHR